jgi:hypothetical protein
MAKPMIQRTSPSTDTENTTAPDGRPQSAQPKWRRDFPIDWGQDDYVTRRDLVKFMVLTSGAFAVGQLWLVVKRWFGKQEAAPGRAEIAKLDELAVGGAKTFH